MLLSKIASNSKKWWQYYDLAFGPIKSERVDLYESLFRQNASCSVKNVLELGCGAGRWLIALGNRGYKMTGIDVDTAALALANEKCKNMGLRMSLIENNLASWKSESSYDTVIAPNNTLKWLPNHDSLRRCLTQTALALRHGGIAIFDLSFEEANWRFCDWGSEDELEEHAWVSEFIEASMSGEYKCFCGMPNLDKGIIPFIERFICQENGEEVRLENRTTWLLFSAGEFKNWVLETGLLDNVKFFDRKTRNPTEIPLHLLETVDKQCLIVCQRKG